MRLMRIRKQLTWKFSIASALAAMLILTACSGSAPDSSPGAAAGSPPPETAPTADSVAHEDVPLADNAQILREWVGRGAKITEPFTITEAPWQIQSVIGNSGPGNVLRVSVFEVGKKAPIAVASNTTSPGEQFYQISRPGQYFLDVNAIGRWAVRIVGVGVAPTPDLAGATLVGQWQGQGSLITTEVFRIDKTPWAVEWTFSGGVFPNIFQSSVYRVGEQFPFVTVANTDAPWSDVSYVYETGEFFLVSGAFTSWSIRVVVPN